MRFLRDYWFIPVLAVVAILGIALWITTGGKSKAAKALIARTGKELRAIAAQREARDIELKQGHEAAKKHVDAKYAAKRETLDAKQEARVKELEDDPEAMAKALDLLTNT